jgi:hypothetical protein
VALALSIALAMPLAAQRPGPILTPVITPTTSPGENRIGQQAALLAGNSLLNGLTAGILQSVRGGKFGDGFLKGLAGGAITYSGKALVSTDFRGSGLAGRGLSAIGNSVTRNAAAGLPTLERLTFPVGPFRLHIRPDGERLLTASVDIPAAASIGIAMVTFEHIDWDWGQSLSQGTLVGYVTDSTWADNQLGKNWAGLVLIDDRYAGLDQMAPTPEVEELRALHRQAMSHEMVHTLQYDQMYAIWGEPLDDWLFGRGKGRLPGWMELDFGFHLTALIAANAVISYESRPWEVESRYME